MKTLKKYFALIILLSLMLFKNNTSSAQHTSVSFQVFYDNLSPYGDWVVYPDYGYVWVPAAGPDFFPYSSGGYWAYTIYGWTWVSEYPWGWAPFHYGRWAYDSFYGWVWVPDSEWGPAWVVWRRSPGYYGWAPVAPGVSINIMLGGTYEPPYDNWVFVGEQYIGRPDINSYYGPRKDNTRLIQNSTIINNTYVDSDRKKTYISGPEKNEVQKIRGKNIETIEIKDAVKPEESISNNQLQLYRPSVTKKEEAVPAKVTAKTDIKPVSERKNLSKTKREEPAGRDSDIEQNKNEVKEKPADNKPAIQKEVEAPVKEKPQPVVPDNTRTKKMEPQIAPKTNEKVREEQKNEPLKTSPEKPIEKRTPPPTEHKAPRERNQPNQQRIKQTPAPAPVPTPAPKEAPRQPQQKPHK
jgi:hypothetical protein